MVDHQSHSVFNHDKLRLKLFVYINIYLLIVCHKRGPDAFRYESKMPHSATFWSMFVSEVPQSYMANFDTILKESLRNSPSDYLILRKPYP